MNDDRPVVVLARHPRNHLVLDAEALTICPNREIARELQIPPMTFDEIAADVLAFSRLSVAPDDVALRCLREACASQAESHDPGGLARSTLSAVNLLFRTGANLEQLQDASSEPVRLVASLAASTRRRLIQIAMVAKADALQKASTLGPSPRRILVFGYSRLGLAEREFVRAVAAPGSVVYLPDYAPSPLFDELRRTAQFFESAGWEIETRRDDDPATVGQRCADAFVGLPADRTGASIRSYPTPEFEVRAVLGQIKTDVCAGLYPLEDAVLVTRSEAVYGPIVRDVAWEYGLPVQTHDSVSVLDSRLGRWLKIVLDIAESGDLGFESAARLYRAPLGEAFAAPGWAESQAWIDARKTHTGTESGWAALGVETDLVRWPDSATRAEWGQFVLRLVHRAGVAERLADSGTELAACERFADAVSEMSLPPNDLLPRAAAIEELRDILSGVSSPAGCGRTGIHLHTPLALFGASIPHVFVMGASDGMLPKTIRDESALDFHERLVLKREIGLDIETAADAARREFLSLYSLLLVPTETIRFSYPRRSGSQAQTLSPLIARIGIADRVDETWLSTAASAAELVDFEIDSQAEQCSERAARAKASLAIVRSRESGVRNDVYTGSIGIAIPAQDLSFSATQLNLFGQCRYAWFMQKLLNLADPDEAEDDLSPSAKGRLFHAVLNRAATTAIGKPNQRTEIVSALNDAFDREVGAMSDLKRLPAWEGRRIELLNQIKRAVESEDFLPAPREILAVERDFNMVWRGLKVRGRIDRIDRAPDGYIVVDYKTSSSKPPGAKGDDGKLSIDVQLPIYMNAAAEDLLAERVDIGGAYYSLSSGSNLTRGYKPGEPEPPGLAELADKLKASLAEGSFPVDPDLGFAACKYCAFDSICRKGPHLSRPEPEARP